MLVHTVWKGQLLVKHAGRPCGVGVGTILVSNISTAWSSCTVRFKYEDDRGVAFHCVARLNHVILFFVRLSNLHVCYFCVTICWCYDIEKFIKEKEKEKEKKQEMIEIKDMVELW